MMRFGEDSFETLASHVSFCLENIRHPKCSLEEAGRFYEEAAEALRAHAILRLLIDANREGFSSDLVMSGQARRAWLDRCARSRYADYFLALSRSGSMLDAVAAEDWALAGEIFKLSPSAWRQGDEYEDDYCYQRFLGLHLTGGAEEEALVGLERAAERGDGRVAFCRVLHHKDATQFEAAFQRMLERRASDIVADKQLADEDLSTAIGTQVFVEGIALLKLARRAGLSLAAEYPGCPSLALLPGEPGRPPDEFSSR